MQRNEIFGRPIRFSHWQISDDILLALEAINTSGNLDQTNKNWGLKVNTILLGVDGWNDISQFPFLDEIPIDTGGVKGNDPDVQLLLYTFQRNKDGSPMSDLVVLILNQKAMSVMPSECQTIMIFEALVYLNDAIDMALWARSNSVLSCFQSSGS
jgi:hypothetical protein